MKTVSRALLFLAFIAGFSFKSFGQQAAPTISTQKDIEESINLTPCESKERLAAVKKLFSQMGAEDDEITIEKYDKDKISNLVVKKKGKSEETIIVGAHYDKADEGCGALDNWTGVVILAHLYRTLSRISPDKSYIFVAFDKEEKGLLGSKEMAKAIPKENRSQYCAMVNLDSFGLGIPQSFREMSDSKLISIAKSVSDDTKIPFADASIANAGADSISFKTLKIPSITLMGMSNVWQNYLHTAKDKTKNVNSASVYFGYRFALSFLVKLETADCRELR